ncbi:MAG TPA: hypothetical protein VNJ09_01685 [Chthonomonadales bacterium]|nr:hypothetical protein [Chthonomonadales bacterium]
MATASTPGASHICLDEHGVAYIAGTTTKAIEVVLNQCGSGATSEE